MSPYMNVMLLVYLYESAFTRSFAIRSECPCCQLAKNVHDKCNNYYFSCQIPISGSCFLWPYLQRVLWRARKLIYQYPVCAVYLFVNNNILHRRCDSSLHNWSHACMHFLVFNFSPFDKPRLLSNVGMYWSNALYKHYSKYGYTRGRLWRVEKVSVVHVTTWLGEWHVGVTNLPCTKPDTSNGI